MAHRHGSGYPRPQAKGELILHMEQSHPESVKVKFDPHRWSRSALVELHDSIHIGSSS